MLGRVASSNGHVVKLLLQEWRAILNENDAILLAGAGHGHVEVKLHLQDQRVDPAAMLNTSILSASENGHVEVVKIFLGRLLPTYKFLCGLMIPYWYRQRILNHPLAK